MGETNRPFGIHTVHDFVANDTAAERDGIWRRAVCRPYPGNRLTAAWWVLRGKAHAIVWPGVGDLEAAMGIPHPKPTPAEGE